ncbi:MAG: DUF2271 domain-containing protein [Acidimicrobiales bacterium]
MFPAGGELLVSFSYQSSSAQAKRPYVAVWIEDADGNFVDTVSLWFEQTGAARRYLRELRDWYNASGASDTTMSGATRTPGDYTVSWDGTGAEGNLVPAGSYVLHVEAAREHGPSSYTAADITVDRAGFSVTLADDGELSGSARPSPCEHDRRGDSG